MASVEILNREKAIAVQEAAQTVVDLLGEGSARLRSAEHDVVGRQMDDFVFAMLVAELTRVVAAQQERIEKLEAQLKKQAKR